MKRDASGEPLYAIGDVHGQLEALQDLLDRIRAHATGLGTANPEVILIGDVIDRGPESKAVIELLMAGVPGLRLQVLMGNHERMLLDSTQDDEAARRWLFSGGAETIESYGVAIRRRTFLDDFHRHALPAAHRDWLANLPLTVRRGRNFFVHAGIHPGRLLQDQTPADLLWIRSPFLSWKGPFPEDVRVFHGHTPVPLVEVYEHRVNLDSGAGHGGPLSAVAIIGDDVTSSDFW
jgi:serine/threonine protein phosphatase 1